MFIFTIQKIILKLKVIKLNMKKKKIIFLVKDQLNLLLMRNLKLIVYLYSMIEIKKLFLVMMKQ